MENAEETGSCISNESNDNSDVENQNKSNYKKSASNTVTLLKLKRGAYVAQKINVNKINKPLCNLNSQAENVAIQNSSQQTQSPFLRARATFTQVRRCKSADAAILNEQSLRETTKDNIKVRALSEDVIEEYAEEDQPTNELDMLLNLFEAENLENNKSLSGEKSQRKAPAQSDGYAQQLYQTLEASDADYKFFKREQSFSDTNGIELLVKNVQQSFGIYVAVVAAPQPSLYDNWLLVLDEQMALQIVVGSKLKAYFDSETINNAYSIPFSINPNETIQTIAIFVEPNQILLSNV